MATGMAAAAANSILDTDLATYRWVKLHVGNPGAAATSNPAANTTRKQTTFAPAAGGISLSTADVLWSTSEVTTAEEYTHFSLWDASTGGTVRYTGTITGGIVNAGNEFILEAGDISVSIGVMS